MRLITYCAAGKEGVGVLAPDGYRGFLTTSLGMNLAGLLGEGARAVAEAADHLLKGPRLDLATITLCPPVPQPGKIICIGLNYADHSAESGFEPPAHPAVFARYATSLVAHGAPIVRPLASNQLDFEGELAVVIGRGGRHILREQALDHVGGYSVFNDASLRDYQFRSTQWTLGKTFDGTGGFGPELVTPDELPEGAAGLTIQTRLNGEVVQSATTDDLIFDVAELIATLSEVMTLCPGDVVATGTPAGVGAARKPPLWMGPGDICEVEIEGVGLLSNPIRAESSL